MNAFYEAILLYWSKGNQLMIIARITFRPEHADRFIDSLFGSQCVTEQVFASPEELIETMKGIEDYVEDCTAVINGKMISLKSFA